MTHTITQEQTSQKNNQSQGAAYLIANDKYGKKAKLNAQRE